MPIQDATGLDPRLSTITEECLIGIFSDHDYAAIAERVAKATALYDLNVESLSVVIAEVLRNYCVHLTGKPPARGRSTGLPAVGRALAADGGDRSTPEPSSGLAILVYLSGKDQDQITSLLENLPPSERADAIDRAIAEGEKALEWLQSCLTFLSSYQRRTFPTAPTG